jgi:hypothetical protein
MTQQLKLLNALLLLFLAMVGQVIWKRAHDASTAQALLWAPLENTTLLLPAPLLASPPLKAASYLEVAEGNLFSPDRNSTITLKASPAKALPPPPIPLLSGVILMPWSPPTILRSVRSGAEKQAYHVGDKIGDWHIDSIDRQQIVLECQGNRVTKQLTELLDRTTIKAQPPQALKAQNASTGRQQRAEGN